MRTRIIMTVVVILSAALVSLQLRAGQTGPAQLGSPAPHFSLMDQNGKAVSPSDYKGKIIVLEWWNEACPYIQRHAKAGTVQQIVDYYGDKDVVVLAINSTRGNTPESNRKAAEQYCLNYPILSDAGGAVGKEYGAKATPHMFIIDKSGNLAYSGAIDDDPSGKSANPVNYVAKALDDLIAARPVGTPQTKAYGCHVAYAK